MTKEEEIQNYSDQVSIEIRNDFNKILNPVEDFDPNTFDPSIDYTQEYYALKRDRVDLPEFLPTMWMKPKQILEWQMIWMYESKQDLYLILAHKINELKEEINLLKQQINNLK